MDHSEKIEKRISAKTQEMEEIKKENVELIRKIKALDEQLKLKHQDFIRLQTEINALKEIQNAEN